MAFLEISSVSKSFGAVKVLDDITLEIERGEFVVFVGPSGCGKSTLLRMITGLDSPNSGTVSIEGKVMNDIEPAKRGTAMVFQSYALYPHMSAYDNVSFGLRMAHTAKTLIRQRVDAAAAILRLDKLLHRRPRELSGGQKQRVAIGRAIVREPRVFLFDEPLSNLDAELRVQMRAELIELHRRLDVTMIYVTHDQIEAMTMADRMVVLNAGRMQQVGRPLDLYDDPDNRFVAGFVGSPRMNFLAGEVVGADATSTRLLHAGGTGPLTLPIGGLQGQLKVEIGVRPDHLRILADGEDPPPAAIAFTGRVTFVEELGNVTYVHIVLDDGTPIVVGAGRGPRIGTDDVRITAPVGHALLFAQDGCRLRGRNGTGK
ncbi:MAG: ABC transporter ATP-binding protein [Ancalomicrobiaceae bacterium]|nr:ABC transporter ATP-binding protein [Ancalomicrobiaceae bacterium]